MDTPLLQLMMLRSSLVAMMSTKRLLNFEITNGETWALLRKDDTIMVQSQLGKRP